MLLPSPKTTEGTVDVFLMEMAGVEKYTKIRYINNEQGSYFSPAEYWEIETSDEFDWAALKGEYGFSTADKEDTDHFKKRIQALSLDKVATVVDGGELMRGDMSSRDDIICSNSPCSIYLYRFESGDYILHIFYP